MHQIKSLLLKQSSKPAKRNKVMKGVRLSGHGYGAVIESQSISNILQGRVGTAHQRHPKSGLGHDLELLSQKRLKGLNHGSQPAQLDRTACRAGLHQSMLSCWYH
jgi:hypothetical protein